MRSHRVRAVVLSALIVGVSSGWALLPSGVGSATGPAEGANDTGIYGIVLLKPLTGFQECPIEDVPAKLAGYYKLLGQKRRYKSPQRNACYQHQNSKLMGQAPTGTENLLIRWPDDKRPEVCKSLCLSMGVTLINGVVQGLTIEMSGIRTPERDYELLEAKFGRPTVKEMKTVQNGMGATFEVLDVAWQRPGGVTVFFTGPTYELGSGMLRAVSSEEVAHSQAEAAKQNAGKPTVFGGTEDNAKLAAPDVRS
jgi:hypothetical protein